MSHVQTLRRTTAHAAAAISALAMRAMLASMGALVALCLAGTSSAQTGKPRIEKAADLPRFTYKVEGPLEDIVRSADKFTPLAAAVRRDTQGVIDKYEIPDRATKRGLINLIAILDYLDRRYDDALARAEEVRALQEKPADKLLSGLRLRVMAQAAKAHGPSGEAFQRAVAEGIARELAPLDYAVIVNDIRELKEGAELIGEALILGRVREVMQPIATRTGELSSDFAPGLLGARFSLLATLPLKATFTAAFGSYLDAHKVTKPDIWAARDLVLDGGRALTPVRIAVWDSGVDIALFGAQLLRDAKNQPVYIAYDKYSRPSKSLLVPLPEPVRARLPELTALTKGFSDLQSNIDSPEAARVKKLLSELAPADYKKTVEELGLMGNYEHGTHVAGIALAGNPSARLVPARLEFDAGLHPDPCPSRAQALRDAAAAQATVNFFKAQKVRVVNMSWGGDVASIEQALEQCGTGKTPEERKKVARGIFEIQKKALTAAFAGAPGILFIAAAGNSNNDPAFVEDVPAAIVLPNLLTVGAVDQAGDEAGFTSYGTMVKVHANGYQVESYLPGGARVALSGTSMAAPQVANLASKLLAVDPKLTPQQVIKVIVDTAERTPDGRRNLIHPKKAVAAVGNK
jgi:hypothetical protein